MCKRPLVLCTSLAFTALVIATPLRATTVEISEDHTDPRVALSDVAIRGDTVTGHLVNRSSDEIRDIRLLVDLEFLWTNELEPGADSPGRAVVLTVPGPLPANGTIAFELRPNPPIPARTDGRFHAKAHVMGYEYVAGTAAR